MKKIKTIILMLGVILSISGCSIPNRNETVQEDISKITDNPFNLDDIESGASNVMASYGYEITNMDCDKRIIDYDGDALKFKFCINNCAAECNTGMVIFIDGIAQRYTMNGDSEQKVIMPVHLNEKSKSNFELNFEPCFGTKNEEHEVFIACMYEPDYVTPRKSESYGNYHQILPMLPWKLTYKNDDVEDKIADQYDTFHITDQLKNEYIHKSVDGTITNQLNNSLRYKLLQNGKEVEGAITSKDNKAEFQIELFGGGEVTYRLSAYINNELVEAFDGKNYLDISTRDEEVSIADGSIDLKKYKTSKINSFYIFMVPISEDGFRDDYMIEKTNTINVIG